MLLQVHRFYDSGSLEGGRVTGKGKIIAEGGGVIHGRPDFTSPGGSNGRKDLCLGHWWGSRRLGERFGSDGRKTKGGGQLTILNPTALTWGEQFSQRSVDEHQSDAPERG